MKANQYYAGACVVITGAGSGIGRLMALRIVEEGGRVAIWDINGEAVENGAATTVRINPPETTITVVIGEKTYILKLTDIPTGPVSGHRITVKPSDHGTVSPSPSCRSVSPSRKVRSSAALIPAVALPSTTSVSSRVRPARAL